MSTYLPNAIWKYEILFIINEAPVSSLSYKCVPSLTYSSSKPKSGITIFFLHLITTTLMESNDVLMPENTAWWAVVQILNVMFP